MSLAIITARTKAQPRLFASSISLRAIGTENPSAQHSYEPLLFTVPEACAQLRVSRWALYQLIRSGRLKTIRIGSRRLVPRTAVSTLIRELIQEGTW